MKSCGMPHVSKRATPKNRKGGYTASLSIWKKVFPEKNKLLRKINIPIVILAADTVIGSNYDPVKNIYRVGPKYFRQWFSYFFDECYENYRPYCSSGSIKKEKTLKRLEIMEGSLIKYFELEETAGPEQTGQATPLSEGNPPDGPALPDSGMPLADTDETGHRTAAENGEEKEGPATAPTSEGISPHAVSGDVETGKPDKRQAS